MKPPGVTVLFVICLYAGSSAISGEQCGVCSPNCEHPSGFKSNYIAYVGAQSDITVEVKSSISKDHPKLLYRFCHVYNISSAIPSLVTSIGCVHNNSFARQEVNWTENGVATVVVEVLPLDASTQLACGTFNTSVYNADKGDIRLTVKVVGPPTSVKVEHYLKLGNITFIPDVDPPYNTTQLYFRYNFGDQSPEVGSSAAMTHTYTLPDNYTYWVDAIAVVGDHKAYWTRSSSYIILQEAIANVDVTINGGEPVLEEALVTVDVNITGSPPVIMCWYVQPQSMDNLASTNNCSGGNLWTLNEALESRPHRFTDIGDLNFVAEFANNVSNTSGIFPFKVLKDTCKDAIKSLEDCTDHPNITHFRVDKVAYIGESSDLVVEVNSNVTAKYSSLLYRFCADRPNHSAHVCNITSGNEIVVLSYNWTNHTEQKVVIKFLVQVFPSNTSDVLLGCAHSNTTVYQSDPGQLMLDVKLQNDTQKSQFHPVDPKALIVGNITFISSPGVNPLKVIYHVKFEDDEPETEFEDLNARQVYLTHFYNKTGKVFYHVEAIAVYDDSEAYHTGVQNYTTLAAVVENITIHIPSNDSVTQNSDNTITFSSRGSLPIDVCWHVEKVNGSTPIHSRTSSVSGHGLECLNNQTQTVLHNTSYETMHMTFHDTGDYQFVATFQNVVSRQTGTFKFKVVSAMDSVITAVVAVVVVLIVVTVIIIVIVAIYIPYRRYKNRMTETANFQFVELNHKTSLRRSIKNKIGQLHDKLRRGHSEKSSVTGEDSEPRYGSIGTQRYTSNETLQQNFANDKLRRGHSEKSSVTGEDSEPRYGSTGTQRYTSNETLQQI